MRRCRPLLLLLAMLVATAAGAAEPEEEIEISAADADSEVEFDLRTGIASADKGVVVRYRYGPTLSATLTARRVKLSRETAEADAEGDVMVQSREVRSDGLARGHLWRGERVHYNFRTRDISASEFRLGVAPFFVAGSEVSSGLSSGIHSATNAIITSDDVSEPAYRIKARELRISPGRYIEAKGAWAYLGSVPIFYWPTYHKRLYRHPSFWTVTAGYRSLYGPYALSAFHWSPSTNTEAAIRLDYRLKRGPGAGPDFNYDAGRWGQGILQGYYTHDDEPGTLPNGSFIDEDRYRVSFTHSLTNWNGFHATAAVRYQSDPYVIRDFFESEYRHDVQPNTYFEAGKFWRNFSLDVVAQPQVNDFFQTVERLPDVKLSSLRQQVGVTPVYYEGEMSAAYLRFQPGLNGGTNYSGFRGDIFQQMVLPRTFFGWLNLTPRVGGRFSYYTEPDGLSAITNEVSRLVFNTGAEMSMKASRVWSHSTNRLFEVSGLRHIVEPSVNYVFVPEPNARPPELPQFDHELQSLRLLPVDFPDYNSIDSIDTENVLRFSLRNKLQTKRSQGSENLVDWRLVTDWRLDPQPGQTTFPELYSNLEFAPRSWLHLNSELRYDINQRDWIEVDHRLSILPNDTWHWTLGNRFLRDDPNFYGEGNNLLFSSLLLRFNENWALRLSHVFEARDGTLEDQYYTLYRDFRSWTGALTFRIRNNRDDDDDWAIVFTFSLKAFPKFKVGEDLDRPLRLLGG